MTEIIGSVMIVGGGIGVAPLRGLFQKLSEMKICDITVVNGLRNNPFGKEDFNCSNYFEINEESNGIERLINAINGIEGELKDSRVIDVSANKYYYFVALALILIFIDLLIGLKTVHL